MTTPSAPAAPEPQRTPVTVGALWRLWATMLVFGMVNLGVIIGISSIQNGIVGGLVYLAVVIVLAALAYAGLHWRYIALGLLAGYVLMTICSAGVCTLLNPTSSGDQGAIYGLIIYPLALAIFFVALVIASIVAANRSK